MQPKLALSSELLNLLPPTPGVLGEQVRTPTVMASSSSILFRQSVSMKSRLAWSFLKFVYLMCTGIFLHVCVHHVCAGASGGKKKASVPLELDRESCEQPYRWWDS